MSAPPDQGPLGLFDVYLRILSDSYLAFLQERRKIEEDYYDSLVKLHRKTLNVDLFFDARLESTTLRSAWSEVRDNVEREAQTRRAFMDSITREVINPLISFKETQDRIRKRIRNQMKGSIQAHNDYVENVLPKLKRAYLKKSQDAEYLKSVALSAASHARPDLRHTDLSDIASQGKKQLNQLITFLDKGVDKDPLHSVRAKREADEADVQYRNAVHWCETLRLNREKTTQAGYNSLESFIYESSETIKKVLGSYADNLTALSATNLQLATHCAQQVEKVSTHPDMKGVNVYIAKSLASSTPTPIPYYSYHVGECKNLIFGFSLQDYATARDLPEGEIPKIVRICVEEVDKRGLDVEGIYRVSGSMASVNGLRYKIERNEEAFRFNPTDDIYVIASLLKMYLRELPEPLFKFSLEDRVQHTVEFEKHFASDFQLIRAKIRRLPPIHRHTLKAVLLHLNRVASHRERNRMDARNLAMVFGIFGNDDEPRGDDLLNLQGHNDTFMEALIIHSPTLFDDQSNLAYTKLPEYDPRQQTNAQLPQTSAGDDFIPQLPPRPSASIHPSSRGNSESTNVLFNRSPTRSEAENDISYIPTSLLPTLPKLRGTKGLDFSQPEILEEDWTWPTTPSPPLSDPPTPKASQTTLPPSSPALPQSTFAPQQQQQQPMWAQILARERPQLRARYPASMPTIDSTVIGDFESITSFGALSNSTVDDGH